MFENSKLILRILSGSIRTDTSQSRRYKIGIRQSYQSNTNVG